MKLIIFSDTHLTDKFDKKKYRFLKSIIEKADQVIINGDFWDGYRTNFDDFVKSKWSNLFPLLKKKRAIYLYGNHDDVKLSNGEVKKFSIKQDKSLTLTNGSKVFHVQHGHAIKPPVYRVLRNMPPNKMLAGLIHAVFKFGVKLMGERFFAWFFLPAILEQQALKNWAKKTLSVNEYLICGHSHIAEIDEETGYINTGFIDHGHAQYVEINNWQPRLIRKKY